MPSATERVAELSLELGLDLNNASEFSYSWHRGYEKLEFKTGDHGGYSYEGAYHPDGTCEGNPCKYCGMATYERN